MIIFRLRIRSICPRSLRAQQRPVLRCSQPHQITRSGLPYLQWHLSIWAKWNDWNYSQFKLGGTEYNNESWRRTSIGKQVFLSQKLTFDIISTQDEEIKFGAQTRKPDLCCGLYRTVADIKSCVRTFNKNDLMWKFNKLLIVQEKFIKINPKHYDGFSNVQLKMKKLT